MSQFTIEKGVPLSTSGAGGKPKFPYALMEVGDSFLADTSLYSYKSVRASSSAYGIRHNKKYKTRTVEGGVRVWRVA